MGNFLVINCERNFEFPFNLEEYLSDKRNKDIDTLLFVYWKWPVPEKLLNKYRCIGFHTGPLLEKRGRGGSPIQNLQKLGVKITTLCAFEMSKVLDGGKVILAVPLDIEGDMRDIWGRIYDKLPEMIDYITARQPYIPEKFTRKMALT